MFLTPAPYVDASAANAFASPYQRLVVSAAGILVEMAIACLALSLVLPTSCAGPAGSATRGETHTVLMDGTGFAPSDPSACMT